MACCLKMRVAQPYMNLCSAGLLSLACILSLFPKFLHSRRCHDYSHYGGKAVYSAIELIAMLFQNIRLGVNSLVVNWPLWGPSVEQRRLTKRMDF
jgi:hypothetical protein